MTAGFEKADGYGMKRNRILGALCCLAMLLCLSAPARSSVEIPMELLSSKLSVDAEGRDTVAMVQYSDLMQRCAAQFSRGRDKNCLFVRQVDRLRHSFWIWRDESGHIINRTMQGRYRLRRPGCLKSFCVSMECLIPASPTLLCDDGTQHVWSAPDRLHFEIDGIVFERVRKD